MAGVEQEVRAAGIMRDYAKLAAPFSGVVITKPVAPRSLATPGVQLLTIEEDELYRLEASVDESKLASIRVGQAVEVVIEASDRKLNAAFPKLSHRWTPQALLYRKAGPSATPHLRTGIFGRATFPLGMQKVVAIPVAALMERGQLQSVFVVEDGAAHGTRLLSCAGSPQTPRAVTSPPSCPRLSP